MAIIRVYRDEALGDDFPPMCMRCGAEAELRVPQKFAWMPAWVHVFILMGLLPWLIVAVITRKTMWVDAPMCPAHIHHWRNRKLFIWLGLFFWIAAVIAAVMLSDDLPKDAVMAVFAGLLFGALAWLVVGLLLVHGAIRAAEIRDSGIELANVNRDFAREWRLECEQNDRRNRPNMRRRTNPNRSPLPPAREIDEGQAID